MKLNPYSNDDYQKASEYLRLTLAMLSRYQIPPSPFNYQIGYDYVAGNNATLKASMDELLEETQSLPENHLWNLYKQFYEKEDKSLEKMRQELRHIITNIQTEFIQTGGDLTSYSSTLNHFSSILSSPVSPDQMTTEVKKVIDHTRTMEDSQERLESQISSMILEVETLRKELEQVKEESLTDALTGIMNRKAFNQTLEEEIQTSVEKKLPFCLLMLDIDHFKKFNDIYGHLIGDKVLQLVATVLKHSIKGRDVAARFGGEEFALIFPETRLKDALIVAEQIRKTIAATELKSRGSDQSYGKVTVSAGVSEYQTFETSENMIERADQALYLAKEQGRNRIAKAA